MPLAFSKLSYNKTQVLYSLLLGPAGLWLLMSLQSLLLTHHAPSTHLLHLRPANVQGLGTCCSSFLECTATDIRVALPSSIQVFSQRTLIPEGFFVPRLRNTALPHPQPISLFSYFSIITTATA